LESLELSIAADSIETGVKKRDNHLRSHEFLDAYEYAAITFQTEKITQRGTGKLRLVGNLTIHGVTKEVAVDMELTPPINDAWGNVRRGAKISGKLDRTDFGITYNAVLKNGSLLIGNEVDLIVDLQFIRKQETTGQ
jgi:polyisoprenoid-binding protein YceI